MSGREALRRRRERLIAEAEEQREDLARALGVFEAPLRILDAGIGAGRAMRRRTGPLADGERLRAVAVRAVALAWRLIGVWQAARLARDLVTGARGVRARIRTRRRASAAPERRVGRPARPGRCAWRGAGPPRAGGRR